MDFDKNLSGKKAIVTGGTRGIGRSITESLVKSGVTVFANYLSDHESAESLQKSLLDEPGSLHIVQCHLGDRDARRSFWAEVDLIAEEIDYLIVNAATGVHRPVSELSANSFRKVLGVNLESSLEFIRESYQRMPQGSFLAGEKGRVIALSSMGSQRALRDYGSVGVSKAALEALMRQFARELGPEGINFNIVRPGLVDTGVLDYLPEKNHIIESTAEKTPNRRLVSTQEVSQLVLFLLGANSCMINGQSIDIDGGFGIVE